MCTVPYTLGPRCNLLKAPHLGRLWPNLQPFFLASLISVAGEYNGSTVVEHFTPYLKIKGSTLATGTRREKMAENFILFNG